MAEKRASSNHLLPVVAGQAAECDVCKSGAKGDCHSKDVMGRRIGTYEALLHESDAIWGRLTSATSDSDHHLWLCDKGDWDWDQSDALGCF